MHPIPDDFLSQTRSLPHSLLPLTLSGNEIDNLLSLTLPDDENDSLCHEQVPMHPIPDDEASLLLDCPIADLLGTTLDHRHWNLNPKPNPEPYTLNP